MVIAPRAREASVQISLQFDRSRTVDAAAQDVQAAINATPGQLPLAESCAGCGGCTRNARRSAPLDGSIILVVTGQGW
jgi:hypothetical protein